MFAEMASPENEEETAEVENSYRELLHVLEKAETASLMNGEFDQSAAILTVHAGAGGVDAQDWARMLARMYLRWAEREGFKADMVENSPAEEGGIHSAAMIISGRFAFGWLSSERGVHRLVRLSPFDAAHRRHTSFAKVDVVPELSDEVALDIRPEPAVSTSTKPNRPSASPTFPPAWSWPAKTSAHSIKTVKWPCACCAPGSTPCSASSAKTL